MKFKNIIRLLQLIGVVSAVWNIVHADKYDGELNELIARAKYIHDRPYASIYGGRADDEKRLDLVEFQVMATEYLKHFCPDNTAVDFIELGMMYKILGDLDVSTPPED